MLTMKKYLIINLIIRICTLIYYGIYYKLLNKKEFKKNTEFFKDIFNIDLYLNIIVIILLIISYFNIKFLPFYTISYLNYTIKAIYNTINYQNFIGIWQLFTTIFELIFTVRNKLF